MYDNVHIAGLWLGMSIVTIIQAMSFLFGGVGQPKKLSTKSTRSSNTILKPQLMITPIREPGVRYYYY